METEGGCMPVYRKNRRELKNFRRYQYRKKPWLSCYGKAFWQTTLLLYIVIVTFMNCNDFYRADCILEPWYQLWITQPAAWLNLLCEPMIGLKKLWLEVAYCPYNRYHYFIPLCICLAVHFVLIPFIIYFVMAAMLATSMGI